jgi:formylglycine-generating enzyme required for sulfatase activity
VVMGGAVLLVQTTERAEDERRAELASKESPYVNGLGMRFVPVPGTDVLMSVWETRVKDYAAYAAGNLGVDMGWKDVVYEGHAQGDDHPVVKVSWEDAKEFCEWLTRRERAAGRIGEHDEYRLPTDHEWSVAVGIGDREDPSLSPIRKDGKIDGVYPWGRQWPPPPGAGNYHGAEGGGSWGKIEGYRDGHPLTAPVGSFGANALGLYDLGGNVWEWCEERWSPSSTARVLRGGSWRNDSEIYLRSSYRSVVRPTLRDVSNGFRVVVEVDGGG